MADLGKIRPESSPRLVNCSRRTSLRGKLFILLCALIVDSGGATTHWVVTEDGKIQQQVDSPLNLKHPHDVVIFMRQETRVNYLKKLEGVQERANLTSPLLSKEDPIFSSLSHRLGRSVDDVGHRIQQELLRNSSSWVLYNMASFYWRMKNEPQRAVDCVVRALHFSPRQHKDVALVNMANILHRAHFSADAAILAHAAMDLTSDLFTSHYTLGNIYAVSRRRSLALNSRYGGDWGVRGCAPGSRSPWLCRWKRDSRWKLPQRPSTGRCRAAGTGTHTHEHSSKGPSRGVSPHRRPLEYKLILEAPFPRGETTALQEEGRGRRRREEEEEEEEGGRGGGGGGDVRGGSRLLHAAPTDLQPRHLETGTGHREERPVVVVVTHVHARNDSARERRAGARSRGALKEEHTHSHTHSRSVRPCGGTAARASREWPARRLR
ncbi:Tetratricopeptide repeat protein 17 [Liparis tanakae]|uniref:Tetratricopeptide repeat protein 17 n=1 Tax=Liparis tanakae TaxID=230148 RepID=A0A4Z2GCN0_9TELE|nr:Tetratricopeptide repeat protein 17 [Liparis tanakae]